MVFRSVDDVVEETATSVPVVTHPNTVAPQVEYRLAEVRLLSPAGGVGAMPHAVNLETDVIVSVARVVFRRNVRAAVRDNGRILLVDSVAVLVFLVVPAGMVGQVPHVLGFHVFAYDGTDVTKIAFALFFGDDYAFPFFVLSCVLYLELINLDFHVPDF